MNPTETTAAVLPCILSEELELFRHSVRSFGQRKLAPGYLERALSDEFPADVHHILAAQGLLGLEVSLEHGGAGADHLAAGIACEEIARSDFNAAYMVFSSSVEGSLIERHSSLADDLLPALLRGDLRLCLGLTEPGSGSDAAAMAAVMTGSASRTAPGIAASRSFIIVTSSATLSSSSESSWSATASVISSPGSAPGSVPVASLVINGLLS